MVDLTRCEEEDGDPARAERAGPGGVTSPLGGAASPRVGVTSTTTGVLPLPADVSSPHGDVPSPPSGAVLPPRGVTLPRARASPPAAAKGWSDDQAAAAPASRSPSAVATATSHAAAAPTVGDKSCVLQQRVPQPKSSGGAASPAAEGACECKTNLTQIRTRKNAIHKRAPT